MQYQIDNFKVLASNQNDLKVLIKNKFNINMCHSAVYVAMDRLNLSYTRPTYVLAKSDKEKQEKFKLDFELLKKIL